MPGYTVLTCPLCGKQRCYEGAAPRDRLIKAISSHILTEHPRSSSIESEDLIEAAITDVDVVELDPSEAATGQWAHRNE